MSDNILTTGELDALRDAVDSEDVLGDVELGPSGRNIRADGDALPRFRLGHEGDEVLKTGEISEERLAQVIDRTMRALEIRLVDVLHDAVSLSVTFLKVTEYAEFRESFEVDARELAMVAFGTAGAAGQGLLVVEPEVVERLVEGLMGGGSDLSQGKKGRKAPRPITDLDLRVAHRTFRTFVDDLAQTWNPASPPSFRITGSDTTGAVAQGYRDSMAVLAVLVEIYLGKKVLGMLGLVMPKGMLGLLASATPSGGAARPKSRPKALRFDGPFAKDLETFPVRFEVSLGGKRMSVREILKLAVGDVFFVEGKRMATGTVQGVPKFLGTPGSLNGNRALQITQVIGKGGGNA